MKKFKLLMFVTGMMTRHICAVNEVCELRDLAAHNTIVVRIDRMVPDGMNIEPNSAFKVSFIDHQPDESKERFWCEGFFNIPEEDLFRTRQDRMSNLYGVCINTSKWKLPNSIRFSRAWFKDLVIGDCVDDYYSLVQDEVQRANGCWLMYDMDRATDRKLVGFVHSVYNFSDNLATVLAEENAKHIALQNDFCKAVEDFIGANSALWSICRDEKRDEFNALFSSMVTGGSNKHVIECILKIVIFAHIVHDKEHEQIKKSFVEFVNDLQSFRRIIGQWGEDKEKASGFENLSKFTRGLITHPTFHALIVRFAVARDAWQKKCAGLFANEGYRITFLDVNNKDTIAGILYAHGFYNFQYGSACYLDDKCIDLIWARINYLQESMDQVRVKKPDGTVISYQRMSPVDARRASKVPSSPSLSSGTSGPAKKPIERQGIPPLARDTTSLECSSYIVKSLFDTLGEPTARRGAPPVARDIVYLEHVRGWDHTVKTFLGILHALESMRASSSGCAAAQPRSSGLK